MTSHPKSPRTTGNEADIPVHEVPTKERVGCCRELVVNGRLVLIVFSTYCVHEVMFAVFLTLLLADITCTSGKYFILKVFLPHRAQSLNLSLGALVLPDVNL